MFHFRRSLFTPFQILLCFFLLAGIFLNAQTGDQLIVTNLDGSGDRVSVREYRLAANGQLLVFTDKESSRSLDPARVASIDGPDGLRIESIAVDDDPAFYQLVVTGPLEVFFRGGHYLVVRKKTEPARITRVPIREGLTQLSFLVRDCHYMTDEFMGFQKPEGYNAVVDLLLKHNRCLGDKEARIIPRRISGFGRERRFRIGFLAGVGFNTVEARDDGTFQPDQAFSVSPSPRVGVALRSSVYRARLGLHAEIALSSFSVEANDLELAYATGIFSPYFFRTFQVETRLGAYYRLGEGNFLNGVYAGISPIIYLDQNLSQTSTFHVIRGNILNEQALNIGGYAGLVIGNFPVGKSRISLEADAQLYRVSALSIDPLSHTFSVVRLGLSAVYFIR